MNKNNVFNERKLLFSNNLVDFSNKIKNQQRRIYFFGLIFILVIFFIFRYTKQRGNIELELRNSSFGAIAAFEASDYNLAISGDNNFFGFENLVKKNSSLKFVNLLRYYLGISYLSIGKYEEAIDTLLKAKLSNKCFESFRFGLIGDCFFEIKDYKNAAFYYIKAANNYKFEYFTPNFLEKAAVSYEIDLNLDKASECYSIINSKYADYKKKFTIKNLNRLYEKQTKK